MRNLKEVAEFEGYLEEDSTAFKELEAKLTPNLEKDFDRFKDEVKRVMAAEIVKRYYYQRGELQESLKDDLVLEKALEVLGDPDLYRRTLSVPVELEAGHQGYRIWRVLPNAPFKGPYNALKRLRCHCQLP